MVRFPWRMLWVVLPGLALAGFVAEEILSSQFQARLFTRLGRGLGYHVEPGPSPDAVPPAGGPYDERLGYAGLPDFVQRLERAGYRIESQARPSGRLRRLVGRWGLFPIYQEKSQTGLLVLDREDRLLYRSRYPGRVYASFETIPEIVVVSLLFIENRQMLDSRYPTRNPAVDWVRLGKAVGVKALALFGSGQKVIGGSTLATQIEKFRHSPEGRTRSAGDKLRQMLSASLRVYQEGANTLPARRRIVVDYVNSVPLAAAAGYGEVSGLGDGLWAWFGRDFAEVNRLLAASEDTPDRALAFKQMLSLFLSQRRPSYYLGENREALNELTNSYVRLLAKEGAISARLRDLALGSELPFQKTALPLEPTYADRKGANLLRNRLTAQLDLPSLYELDRLDLTVKSTLDMPSQEAVSRMLNDLGDPAFVARAGLREPRLLETGDPARVIYAFNLYERSGGANVVRVQTDSLDQPLDLNDGMKLNLGSTAKLRTLISYLEIITALHGRYGQLPEEELRKVRTAPRDRLSAWAVGYLAANQDRSLAVMLEAALDRTYSASPGERFFTGGGLHAFSNFNRDDDGRVMPVREALRKSVNLVFIRLMRDIVNYYMLDVAGSTAKLLEDADDPRRAEYLSRFADREGSDFVRRFYRKHQGKPLKESIELIVAGIRPTSVRLATILGSVDPTAEVADLRTLIATHLPGVSLSDEELEQLRSKYSTVNYSLVDRGYIARVHPLELWVVDYLRQKSAASLSEALAASAAQRQEVYGWLFKTRRKHAQDRRIATLLELEAFLEIHASWQRLGYPFAYLTPSLATAIGSSGDRPSSLAELMGIIANGGVRLPTIRVERLHFAADTPYETILTPGPRQGERIFAPEIAAAARGALLDVVEEGTAQRLRKSLVRPDGTRRVVGGKTGTGDERFQRYAPGGRLIESRFVSRAATFVFMVDERFFGVLTAYVHGPDSAQYGFTSALPVQVVGLLMPSLAPLFDRPDAAAAAGKAAPPIAAGRLPVGPPAKLATRTAVPEPPPEDDVVDFGQGTDDAEEGAETAEGVLAKEPPEAPPPQTPRARQETDSGGSPPPAARENPPERDRMHDF